MSKVGHTERRRPVQRNSDAASTTQRSQPLLFQLSPSHVCLDRSLSPCSVCVMNAWSLSIIEWRTVLCMRDVGRLCPQSRAVPSSWAVSLLILLCRHRPVSHAPCSMKDEGHDCINMFLYFRACMRLLLYTDSVLAKICTHVCYACVCTQIVARQVIKMRCVI